MSFVFYRAIWAEKWGVNTRVSVFLFRCLASITEAGDSLVTLRSRDPGLEPAARERVISSRLESRQMTSLSCEAADRALTLCEDCLLGPDIARGHEAASPARDHPQKIIFIEERELCCAKPKPENDCGSHNFKMNFDESLRERRIVNNVI